MIILPDLPTRELPKTTTRIRFMLVMVVVKPALDQLSVEEISLKSNQDTTSY